MLGVCNLPAPMFRDSLFYAVYILPPCEVIAPRLVTCIGNIIIVDMYDSINCVASLTGAYLSIFDMIWLKFMSSNYSMLPSH